MVPNASTSAIGPLHCYLLSESPQSEFEVLFVHLVSENDKNNETDTVQSCVREMV